MANTRVTLRTRSRTYRTRSNVVRIVRTPGNRLVTQGLPKTIKAPVCRISGKQLHGLKSVPAHKLHTMSKRSKSVTRPYGGNLSAGVVRERIVRAFLREETRFANQVAKTVAKKQAAAK